MSDELLYHGKIFDVVRRKGMDVVVHGPAVAIVPVYRTGHVTLVRQERAAAGGKLLELPAGGVEDGESPLETAKRELREETGLDPDPLAAYARSGYGDKIVAERVGGTPASWGS